MTEIREFFIIAFPEAQPLGPQSADPVEHFTFMGYLRPNPEVEHKLTIAEHLERIDLKRLELPGLKLKRLGRFMVTHLGDPTGELNSFKDELFANLMEDGYICSRKSFYTSDYRPHVTVGTVTPPGVKAPHPKKVQSFSFNSLSLTESRFDHDYNFLGSEVLHTRSF